MTDRPPKTVHDEYWHPHVDKVNCNIKSFLSNKDANFNLHKWQETYETFHFTSLLYLSDYGSEFQGGRFVFIDKDNFNRTVEPRKGNNESLPFHVPTAMTLHSESRGFWNFHLCFHTLIFFQDAFQCSPLAAKTFISWRKYRAELDTLLLLLLHAIPQRQSLILRSVSQLHVYFFHQMVFRFDIHSKCKLPGNSSVADLSVPRCQRD